MVVNNLYKKFITLGYIFFLIPLLSIYGIKSLFSNYANQDLLALSLCIFFIIVMVKASHIKINLAVFMMIVYNIVIISSTCFFHGFSPGILMSMTACLCVFLILQTEEYENILRALCAIVWFSAVINFITLFTVDETFEPMYFIGGKNAFSVFLVPGVCFVLFRSVMIHDKITKPCIFLCVLSLVSIFMCNSATGLVVALSFVALYLVIFKTKCNKYVIIALIFAFYIVLLFSQNFLNSNLWLNFTEILGKEGSLTDRVSIWQSSWQIITESPIIGNGRGGEIGYINSYGLYDVKTEAHNFFLEILFEGGVAALSCYLLMLFKIITGLNMKNKKHRVLLFAICMVLMNGLTESTVNNLFVIIIMGISCKYGMLEKDPN